MLTQIKAVRNSVRDKCVDSRIEEKHLSVASCGGVTLTNGVNVLTNRATERLCALVRFLSYLNAFFSKLGELSVYKADKIGIEILFYSFLYAFFL